MRKRPASIHGSVAPGFEPVRDEFENNFSQRKELGAAVTVYHKGNKVVDLWGGIRDEASKAPWEEDTMVVVFSTTKGMASMALAVAHSKGLFEYDDLVAQYWSEFAENGKDNVTIRQLLNHQAGLCAIDTPLDYETLADLDKLAVALARQKPAWIPGTQHGYHALTLGWYENELIRRVDPQHRSIGEYFKEEIAAPLALQFYIGLPEDIPQSRLATFKGWERWQLLFHLNEMPVSFVFSVINPRSLTARSLSNPKILRHFKKFNDRKILALELPAANGIGEVRSIAKAYSEFATGGTTLNLGPKTLKCLIDPATPPSQGLFDQMMRINTSFSLGYIKPFPQFQFGTSNASFGTPGAGGSFGFADPEAEIGYAYAMNRGGFYLFDDPREKVLRDAVYHCISA